MIVGPGNVPNETNRAYNVALGDSNFQRNGKNIYAKHVYWNIDITCLETPTAFHVRIIGFYPNKQGNDVGLSNSLNQANGWLSSVDKDLGSVFLDKKYYMSVNAATANGCTIQKGLRIFRKLKRKVTYNADTGPPETNLPSLIIVCEVSTTVTDKFRVDGYVSFAYTDI